MEHQLAYIQGIKNSVVEPYESWTAIYPDEDIIEPDLQLYTTGRFVLGWRFPWDGCSGPTRDTNSMRRGCGVHDGLCRLMQRGLLDRKWKDQADIEAYICWRQDGAWKWRAKGWLKALGSVDSYVTKAARPKVYLAPKKRKKPLRSRNDIMKELKGGT